MELLRYVIVDAEENEEDWEYDRFEQAKNVARRRGHAVVVRTYEYTDTALVWTPNGSDTWPPATA